MKAYARKSLAYLHDTGVAYITSVTAVALIVSDVMQGTGWSWAEVLPLLKLQSQSSAAKDNQPEVKDYVEFTIIQLGGAGEVVTGVRYGSSRTRIVVEQWCYLGTVATAARQDTLRLATAKGTEQPVAMQHSAEDLARFGLTDSTAAFLRDEYCRFQIQQHRDT